MKTFKVVTPTTTNYCICTQGFFWAVRKEHNFWRCVAIKNNSQLCTDNYVVVETGFLTKNEALKYLLKRIEEIPKNFYHSVIN